MKRLTAKQRGRGYSLAELLLVLALAAIVCGMALPNYLTGLQRQQLRLTTDELAAALNLARAQAMARGVPVLLVPRAPSAEMPWRLGWMVFVDQNGNRRADPGEVVLATHGPLADDIVVSAAFTAGAATPYVAYNSAGRACSAGNSLVARWGTLSLRQGVKVRNIKINMLGRVRVCDPAAGAAGCGSVSE